MKKTNVKHPILSRDLHKKIAEACSLNFEPEYSIEDFLDIYCAEDELYNYNEEEGGEYTDGILDANLIEELILENEPLLKTEISNRKELLKELKSYCQEVADQSKDAREQFLEAQKQARLDAIEHAKWEREQKQKVAADRQKLAKQKELKKKLLSKIAPELIDELNEAFDLDL